jgi:hypothetical protein
MFVELIVLQLVRFMGPENQVIEINPELVVSVRAPRLREHFAPGVRCIISTDDGKFVTVIEPCSRVRELLMGAR